MASRKGEHGQNLSTFRGGLSQIGDVSGSFVLEKTIKISKMFSPCQTLQPDHLLFALSLLAGFCTCFFLPILFILVVPTHLEVKN